MKIAICILVGDNDSYYQFTELLNNLENNTGIDAQYYIFNNESKDERIHNHLLGLDVNKYTVNLLSKVSKAKALNYLINACKEKYLCIVPINYLVNKMWLEDLYYNYRNCPEAGVISIRNGFEKIFISPVMFHNELNQEVLKNVWVSNNGSVEGLLFFNKEKIKSYYDENLDAVNCEDIDFTFNCFCQGYQNFYITGQNAIRLTFAKNKNYVEKKKSDLEIVNKKWNEIIKRNIINEEYEYT
jgi:hypothetical protein